MTAPRQSELGTSARWHSRRPWRIAGRRGVGLAVIGFALAWGAAAAERVVLFGEPLSREPAFAEGLRAGGFDVRMIDAEALGRLDELEADLAVIAPESACPPASRCALAKFLARQGSVVLIGPSAYDYTPRPVRGVTAVALETRADYEVLQPKVRDGKETPLVEPAQITAIRTPDGRPALEFRTRRRGMNDTLLRFRAEAVARPERVVLSFQARGDAYADLLVVEITDANGARWHSFVPISGEWRRYDVTLADFLPQGWKGREEVPPKLEPGRIATVAVGIDGRTVWREKPMAFAVGAIELAEEVSGQYAPTGRLAGLRVPFHEAGTAIPNWLGDPFWGTKPVAPPVGLPAAWSCPAPLVLHPGVAMGTDHRPPFATLAEREQRREVLLQGTKGEAIAELRHLAGGPYAGAQLALFGLAPGELLHRPELVALAVRTAERMLTRPTLTNVKVNTTAREASTPARPVLQVTVRNPLRRVLRGWLRADVAGGSMQGTAQIVLAARSSTKVAVPLSDVPPGFVFENFAWGVTLETDDGSRDEWCDTVDTERALLHALAHLVRTQRQFPDGRITHHYFGDAYGVRALFAYLDLVRREPERQQRQRDLWAATSAEDLRRCGLRFVDMLLARQNAEGSIPMGYGEHSATYNVADGGQIGLAMGQLAPLLDPERRAACWEFCRRFAAWAETFYIDTARSKQLIAESAPAKHRDAQAGHYGLGSSRGIPNLFGPSWVLPDILGVQVLLTYVDPAPDYRRIVDRNVRAYLDAGYAAAGYYHAEALTWAWRDAGAETLRRELAERITTTFVPPLLTGRADEMFELGARGMLRALPLQYVRRFFGDTPELRAALLKYVWTFGSESSERSMRRMAEAHPKPHHGESIAAAKYAEFGAMAAIELLEPGSSFLRWPGFPRP